MSLEADHDLDAAGARKRIERAFPDLEFTHAEFFAAGCDFRMFEVDGTWLFRFPKRTAEIARLEREIAFLDRVAAELPVEVPRFTWRARDVAGYRKLNGHAMVGRPSTPRFAQSLGEILTVLHGFSADHFVGCTMPGVIETGGLPHLRKMTGEGLAAAREELKPALRTRCEQALATEPPLPFAGTPVTV